mmetsp:Transcript_13629/g.12093  ORF Transcript_13629/g.12093 Transcript_13629/m.12093 type:complete len:100 (+) Transcript_13629:228-527(+)
MLRRLGYLNTDEFDINPTGYLSLPDQLPLNYNDEFVEKYSFRNSKHQEVKSLSKENINRISLFTVLTEKYQQEKKNFIKINESNISLRRQELRKMKKQF